MSNTWQHFFQSIFLSRYPLKYTAYFNPYQWPSVIDFFVVSPLSNQNGILDRLLIYVYLSSHFLTYIRRYSTIQLVWLFFLHLKNFFSIILLYTRALRGPFHRFLPLILPKWYIKLIVCLQLFSLPLSYIYIW